MAGGVETRASVAVLVAAAAWGLYWLPLRAIADAGIDAGWMPVLQCVTPALLLAPFALWRLARGRTTGLTPQPGAVAVGCAFALYADSLLLTEVARALILFYVTPAWSTALEIVFLKRRLTWHRAGALALGFGGLLVILSRDGGLPLPSNLGDVLALLSGVAWAVGTLLMRKTQQDDTFANVFSFFAFGSVAALLLALMPFPQMGQPPAWAALLPVVPWLLLIGGSFLIPVTFVMLWGAKRLDPGRTGILFQVEAVFAVVSAAILTAEPFGWHEALGGCLVIAGALVEVTGRQPRAAAA